MILGARLRLPPHLPRHTTFPLDKKDEAAENCGANGNNSQSKETLVQASNVFSGVRGKQLFSAELGTHSVDSHSGDSSSTSSDSTVTDDDDDDDEIGSGRKKDVAVRLVQQIENSKFRVRVRKKGKSSSGKKRKGRIGQKTNWYVSSCFFCWALLGIFLLFMFREAMD